MKTYNIDYEYMVKEYGSLDKLEVPDNLTTAQVEDFLEDLVERSVRDLLSTDEVSDIKMTAYSEVIK